jgi:DMSO/TMAO reductase YedYZ molybdopterin-dependent catalytic subunit
MKHLMFPPTRQRREGIMSKEENLAGLGRRQFLGGVGALGAAAFTLPLMSEAAESNNLQMPFENGARELTPNFPQKSTMILLRTRPPLLETPFEVFDQGPLTPVDRFYVRWHMANIPTHIDPAKHRLNIKGHVNKELSFSIKQLAREFKPFEIVAVNQCSGNSRGFFTPRVAGGQWGNGAMGNARWTGVRLKDLLEHAGVRPDAVRVRFSGLDTGVVPDTPQFKKSLTLDHAMDGEVMVAYAMNGQPLPLLNGFPLRLVVPGWYATYWVKMLADIEVLDGPDDNFWTGKAYMIPDTPHANVHPGETGFKTLPINRMVPRSFITNIKQGAQLAAGAPTLVRGIAFGGANALAKVLFSADGGKTWADAQLGDDLGKYSFRQWQATATFATAGEQMLMVKAIDDSGQEQPTEANWNGAGFMRNVIESISVHVA